MLIIYIKDEPYSKISASLSYHSENKKSGLLIYSSNIANATDKYWNSTATGNDMITSVIPKAGTDSWAVAEFPIFFDNNIRGDGTGTDNYKGTKWEFDFWGINDYQIKPADSPTMDPIQNGQHYLVGNSANMPSTPGGVFDAANAELVKDAGDFKKLVDIMKASTTDINEVSPNFLLSYKNRVSEVEQAYNDLSPLLSKLTIVGAFVKLFDGFFGAESKNGATAPKATTEQLKLQGTMTLSLHLGGTSLKVLGVNPNLSDPPLLWQPFDCPIGILNLKKTPKLKYSGWYVRHDDNFTGTAAGYYGGYRKWKLEEDIEIAFNNQIPGITLEDLKFAFVFNPNGTNTNNTYRIQDENISTFWYRDMNGDYLKDQMNPVYDALKKGYFIIHQFNKDDPRKTYYGTPFVDKNKLKNIVFEIPDYTDINLAVLATVKLQNYSEPIVIKKYYKIDGVFQAIPNWTSADYVKGLDEQIKIFPMSDYYQGVPKKELNDHQTSYNYAGEIDLLPGFIGDPNFIAESKDIFPSSGNTIISGAPYSFGCYQSLLKSASFINDSTKEDRLNKLMNNNPENNISVFPNPTEGKIMISSTNSLILSVEVFSIMGKIVYQKNSIMSLSTELNLSSLPNGQYIIKITNVDSTIRKIIIKS